MDKRQKYIAKTLHGLEQVLADEIKALGGSDIKLLKRAVSFEGDNRLLYLANIKLRTAIKILMPIDTFRCRNEQALYNGIKKISWNKYMNNSDTFAIDSVVFSNFFKHSKYVALKSKDAIVDRFREATGERPSVDVKFPGIRINVHIGGDLCTVSLDSTGNPLHMRGYRLDHNTAPLNENLAAGMILLSGWNGDKDLVDPMCGSGTLLIEAAMIATNTPPNLDRKEFAFEKWRTHDPGLLGEVLEGCKRDIKKSEVMIFGSDVSSKAISITKENIKRARIKNCDIILQTGAFNEIDNKVNGGIIITNPPYDERLKNKNIEHLYKEIGDTLKKKYEGFDAWVLSGNINALKSIGLRSSRKISLLNGSIECKFQKYEMYSGSKKAKKQSF